MKCVNGNIIISSKIRDTEERRKKGEMKKNDEKPTKTCLLYALYTK